jgi:hypothetical protein
MATPQERQQQQREQKLEAIRRQLEEGTLVIRQMTAEERRANPPKPRTARPRSRRS